MTNPRRFGGEIPQILGASLHPVAIFVGAACALLLWLASEVPARAGGLVFTQAVFSLFFVRAALVARRADHAGALQHPDATLPETIGAWIRLVALNLVWSLPATLAASQMAQLPGILMGAPVGATAALLLASILFLPTVFLVVAVGTDSFGEIFAISTWSRLVFQRRRDVATLALLSAGLLLALGLSLMILSMAIGGGHRGFTIFLVLVSGSYVLGSYSLLLGRLAGVAVRDDGLPQANHEPFEHELDRVLGAADFASRDATDAFEPVAVHSPEVEVGAVSGDGAEVDFPTEEHDVTESTTAPAGSDRMREGEAISLTARLRANERLAQEDALAALQDLDEMLTEAGPHPMVLARKAQLQHGLGFEEAHETAQGCLKAALAVNNFGVLADLYEAFGDDFDVAGLDLSTRLHMAGSLAARHHFDGALSLYRAVLAEDPEHLPAIKAMIQMAEQHLRADDRLPLALNVYDALDEDSPNHPFADFVERGREDVERRLARVH